MKNRFLGTEPIGLIGPPLSLKLFPAWIMKPYRRHGSLGYVPLFSSAFHASEGKASCAQIEIHFRIFSTGALAVEIDGR